MNLLRCADRREFGVEFSRRSFIGFGAALPFAGGVAPLPNKGVFAEPQHDLPLVEDCDILVCGGGPAGIATAVAAARGGAKVRLLELRGSLGGIWTSGLLGCMLDFGRGALAKELLSQLDACGARRGYSYSVNDPDYAKDVYEPEYMKVVCEAMCQDAGVKVQLDTRVVAAYRDIGARNVNVVVTESKSGRQAWRARTFVDATGDGDLAAFAGCGFDIGFADGRDQPASMMAVLSTPDADALAPFVLNNGGEYVATVTAFHEEIKRAGLVPSYDNPTLYRLTRNLVLMMANHEYGVKIDDAAGITAATIHARRENIDIAAALARLGGVWSGLRVAATAEQLGHRTARRIHGRYTLTRADVIAGAKFNDAAGESRFPVDVHAMSEKDDAVSAMDVVAKPFQIPIRAMRAKDLDNLYMAGRCISGDPIALASYRVTGPAFQMGESLGRHLAEK